jgi:large conductance mechanosensitive channel
MISGKDLSQNKWIIKDEVKDAAGKITQPEVALQWGAFLTAVIDFIIVAFVMFLVIKAINSLKKKEPEAPLPPTPEDVILLREIRDALKK